MSIFVKKGDKPLTPVQLEKRSQKYIKRSWPESKREQSIRKNDGEFTAFIVEFSTDHATNIAYNTFNWQLAEYRKAVSRLEKYVLSVGRAEVYEEQPTGEFDEEGNEITESVLVQAAIEPLDATVVISVYDEMTEVSSDHDAPNPLIVADEAEREAAEAVLAVTPADIKGFA
tara:strand:- start:770 stop:1285 length:516 start_codon:yes stop_codon:yes gene_type:complete